MTMEYTYNKAFTELGPLDVTFERKTFFNWPKLHKVPIIP